MTPDQDVKPIPAYAISSWDDEADVVIAGYGVAGAAAAVEAARSGADVRAKSSQPGAVLCKGYYGASAMPAEILHEIRDRLPSLRLWNFYGQTEMAPLASALGPDEQDAHAGSAGRPVVNVETAILDEVDNPLAAGLVGEIAHRSPHLTQGYLEDPERTAAAFRGGWFHSGDLGYYDEHGLLHVVDRKKDMIKTGGENVASREVEGAIYRHGAVEEVAVFGLAHPVWVEAVVAAIVLRDGATVTEEERSSSTAGNTWPASKRPNGSFSSIRSRRTPAANCSNARCGSVSVSNNTHSVDPEKRAAEMTFTGDRVDAATALEWGMINRVVPHDELLAEAHALAGQITKNPPHALRMPKRLPQETR